jgi:hypothetical protein
MNEIEWIRRAIQSAYPNPDHLGCPTSQALEDMARRKRLVTPADHDHIFHCSPCFAAYMSTRNQIRRSRIVRLSTIWTCSTALVVGLTLYTYNHRSLSPPQQYATAFNLQERPVFRGTEPAVTHPSPFVLPRGLVHLSLTLPLGSQPGKYQLQIWRSGDSEPLLNTSGDAVLHADGSTTLNVELNSSRLHYGQYAMGIRQDSGEWSYSPLLIHDPTRP